MPDIVLYELAPTRSLKCRWMLQEADLPFESRGNDVAILGSDELLAVQPLGKLPAAIIDGRPLFESSAIVTAIADLVPEAGLIAPAGTWQRHLHDQWTCFAHAELECWAWTAMLNSRDFLRPEDQHVAAILPQMEAAFSQGAAVIERALDKAEYINGDSFSATDINVAYSLYLGAMAGFLAEFPNARAYLDRLREREHCTMQATS